MSSGQGAPPGSCSRVDERAAIAMGRIDLCWCCADRLYVSDGKLIRAKVEGGHWVVKTVCVGCHRAIMLDPGRIELIEGEHWTLRPWALRPGQK